MAKVKFNVYKHVTDTLLKELNAGTVPWRKPWSGGGAGLHMPLRVTGDAYRGINVVLLWRVGTLRGYSAPTWMTYRQALELGGQVRKGEKSATVVKFGKIKKSESDPVIGAPGAIEARGQVQEEGRVSYARAYHVFNCDQIDGLDAGFYAAPDPVRDFGDTSDDLAPDPTLDAWFGRMGVPIVHSAEPAAYYEPARDRIHMPPLTTFESLHRYFHTLAHEVGHATGASHRLDRRHSGKTKMQRYAQEELVVEISGAMVCARLGIQPAFDQNAAYLKSWIDVLGDEERSRAIVKAASMAQAAADWMFDRAGDAFAGGTTALDLEKG